MLPFVAGLALMGCQGPNAKAGEQQDRADAAANGAEYTRGGPNEHIGRAVDRANRAERSARDAAANALQKQRDSVTQQANIDATRLDERAKTIRLEADQKANALVVNTN